MTTLEKYTYILDHRDHAHDGGVSRHVQIDRGWVSVLTRHVDGTSYREPVGRVSDRGVWALACDLARVLTVVVEEDDGAVFARLTYRDHEDHDTVRIYDSNSGAGWRQCPPELWDEVEEYLETR